MAVPEHSDASPNDGRAMMAVGGLLFVPMSWAACCQLLMRGPKPNGFWGWAGLIFLDELALSAAAFFTIGWLWSLSGSARLRHLTERTAARAAWLMIPAAVACFAMTACVLLFG
jgi:hypothetical protein